MAHMSFATSCVYEMAVINSGHADRFAVIPTSLSAFVFMTSALLMIIPVGAYRYSKRSRLTNNSMISLKLFMVHRIKQLSNYTPLIIICVPIAVVRSVILSALAIISFDMESMRSFVNQYRLLMIFSLVNGALPDVLLSALLVFLLWRKQRELVSQGTHEVSHHFRCQSLTRMIGPRGFWTSPFCSP